MYDINLDPDYENSIYRFNVECFGSDLYHYVHNSDSIWFDENSFGYFLKFILQSNQTPFTITNLSINNSNFTKTNLDSLKNTEFFIGDRIYLACDSVSSTKYFVNTSEILAYPYFFENWSMHEIGNRSMNIFPQLNFALSKFNSYSKKELGFGDIILLLVNDVNSNYKFNSIKDIVRFVRVWILKIELESVAISMRGEIFVLLNFCYNVLNWFQFYMYEQQKYNPVFLTLEQQKVFLNLEYKQISKYDIDLDIDPNLELLMIDFFKNIKIFDHEFPSGL
jgi:hypothetical protein